MIYLFAGNDFEKKRKAYQKFIESIPENTAVFNINKNNFDPMQFESLYSSNGLFFSKCFVILENTFDNESSKEFILKKLDLIEKSNNDFIFLESVLKKPVLDAFKKARTELNIFEKKEIKNNFDTFILANDFASRNKFGIWFNLQKAYNENVSVDAIAGVLFWKVKDMIIKKDFKKFSEEELQNIAKNLSFLLINSRIQYKDDQVSLEEFLLKIV
jgi:DNA polymerase III delta subunit